MTSPQKSALDARFVFVLGMVGAAVVTASACSLTNLDPYTSGGGVADTGGTSGDGSSDVKTDSRADSTKADDGVDVGDDGAIDGGVDTADGTVVDATDAGDASDAADGTLVDSGPVDSTPTDTTPVEGSVGDTGDAACPVTAFGLSEVMVRPVAGSADMHEWLELTNYGTCTLDIGGVTVRVSSSGSEKGVFTFVDGTMVAAGASVVVAGVESVFRADVVSTYTLGAVFNFSRTTGDLLVNGGNITIALTARGGTVPYENALVPNRGSTWPGLGRSYGYPVPSVACPLSARLGAGGALGAAWKDTPMGTTDQYGGTAGDAGGALYGSPTQPNTDIACP